MGYLAHYGVKGMKWKQRIAKLDENYEKQSSKYNKQIQAHKESINKQPENKVRLGKTTDVSKKNLDAMHTRITDMQKRLEEKKAVSDKSSKEQIVKIEKKLKELKAKTLKAKQKILK